MVQAQVRHLKTATPTHAAVTAPPPAKPSKTRYGLQTKLWRALRVSLLNDNDVRQRKRGSRRRQRQAR
jgi:hypothetical protein